jgi:hypothetical protein
MANRNRRFQLFGQFLKFDFPQTNLVGIAAATVGRDQQTLGFGVAFLPIVGYQRQIALMAKYAVW